MNGAPRGRSLGGAPLARLLIVGDELLSGRRADANGAWLARRLGELGIETCGIEVVGDEVEGLAGAIARAMREAAVVVVSGGLGPTPDDRTREALARALDSPLVEDPALVAELAAALARRGRVWLPIHRAEALRPAAARPLANEVGTAAGLYAEASETRVACLPGVPRELRSMFDLALRPLLEALPGRAVPLAARMWVVGRPEADIATVLLALPSSTDVRLAWYPHDAEIEVRVQADTRVALTAFLEASHAALGDDVVEVAEGERIEHAVVRAARAQGVRLAVAESLTGGAVLARLVAVAGASHALFGGWVVYTDEAKRESLGVGAELLLRHGAVSEAAAEDMARRALERSGADLAVATTGVAGPEPVAGPDGEVPVGTVYLAAVSRTGRRLARRLYLPLDRERIRLHATVGALDLLRRLLAAGDAPRPT